MRSVVILMFGLLLIPAASVAAAKITPEAVNNAQWQASAKDDAALLVKAQVLLDRARFSPGEIDGRAGDNYVKALNAFAQDRGLESKNGLSEDIWRALAAISPEPIVTEYILVEKDVKGPFLDKVPTKLDDMKGLSALSYGSPRERLAEQFHMSESLLSELNPGKQFDRNGDTIFVVRGADQKPSSKAASLQIDKSMQTLRAFDKNQKLIAFFPITAGSTEKPAPSGEMRIRSIARNPTYRYNPAYAFKGVRSEEPFTVAPGPNSPVGLVWIGLPGEGFGIHGTPDPGKVGKTESHGCIRLTNWDALALANLISKGTPVTFLGEDKSKKKPSTGRRHRRKPAARR